MTSPLSGAYALAHGAIDAGVSLVTGYPGSPATSVVNAIAELASPQQVQVIWNINEKVAAEMAFGASLAGDRALLCVKGVGFNIALDPLMTINLADCHAGFVVLVGDDPGGWSSQNEQDSRAVALATELPILEPATVSAARAILPYAFHLSEEYKLPIIVRATKPLILAKSSPLRPISSLPLAWTGKEGGLRGDGEGQKHTVILPVNVVANHNRLHQKLNTIKSIFESSDLNRTEGSGSKGVLTTGFTYQKLLDFFDGAVPPELRVASLCTFHPLPEIFITTFLKSVEAVMVLEETAPLLENAVRATAQRSTLTLPIFGRDAKDVNPTGELDVAGIAKALIPLLPGITAPSQSEPSRSMPSKRFFPPDCPYIPTFEALFDVIPQLGSRQDAVIVGDPGCMVRGHDHYQLMDVKTSLGASIGIAAGIARTSTKHNDRTRVIAISGDSSFLHTNFQGLIDAVQAGAQMLILILDNNTTALSGRQPHPGTRGHHPADSPQPVEIANLAAQAGAASVQIVDIDRGENLRPAILTGLETAGVSVVIARGECPSCP